MMMTEATEVSLNSDSCKKWAGRMAVLSSLYGDISAR